MTEHREPYTVEPDHPFGWDSSKDVPDSPITDQLVSAARDLLIDLRHYILDNERVIVVCMSLHLKDVQQLFLAN